MAINKKLIYYNRTLSEFLSDANGLNGQSTKDANNNVGNIPFASIVFTSDGYIWTHGKIFNGNNTLPPVTSVNGQTGDVTLTLDNIADGSTRKLADYLPLSGGTISSNSVLPLILNSYSNSGSVYQQLRHNNTLKVEFGYWYDNTLSNGGVYLQGLSNGTYNTLMICDDGILRYNTNTIWHSGNDSDFFKWRGELYQNNSHNADTLGLGSWIFRGSGYGNTGSGSAHANALNENSIIEVFANLLLSTVAWSDVLYYRTKWGAETSQSRPTGWGGWSALLSDINYTDYTVTKTGTGASGTWGINITGSATYATNATKLYASDSPYRYGDNAPYYAYFTYLGNENKWYLRVYPETPKTVIVDYAYNTFWTGINGMVQAGNEFNIIDSGYTPTDFWINYLPRNQRSANATLLTDYYFGNLGGNLAYINAAGYKKNGSSNSYVLLGGGGHKAISDFVEVTGNQTISGNKTFSSSVSIDDLTVGNLVVNGAASFALTINGSISGSATQLQTSRSIWGQSFNGTGDVDGTIHIHTPNATNFDEGIRIHTSNLGYAGLVFCGTDNTGDTGTSSNTWSIYTNSGNFYINKNASILHSGYELCNVGGNWGIGTISPSYKLDVNGNARIGSIIADNTPFTDSLNIIANQTNESTVTTFNEAASSWGITFIRDWNTQGYNVEQAGIYAVGCSDWRAGLAFRVKANTGGTGYSHDTTAMYITPVGNVGIGTTSPLDKLDIRGTATISDITTMAGAIKVIPSVWSELFTYYGLASDYTSRYDTEEFLKAWVKYAYDKGAGYTVMSYISPNSRGFIEADVYASGINSTTGFPEHITGRYYPHGGSEIIFGTSYGTWYYRTGIDSGNISSQSVYYAGNADTAAYASNVGAAGTAGTNYITAANVISMYNWYNGITATDEASNTAIDKWNEIVSFLTGITDTSTLSGILAGYAAVGHDHDGRYLRNYHKNTDITSTEVVADSDYIHNVGETGGYSTTMTKPTGMDNAWGILHMHLHTGNYAMQLGFGGTTGHMYFRNAYNSSIFDSWKTLIDSDNIGSQSVSYASSAGTLNGMTRQTSNWSGISGLSVLMGMSDTSGGDCLFMTNSSGQMSFVVDGALYLRIDSTGASRRVLDEYDLSNTAWGTANFAYYSGYANYTRFQDTRDTSHSPNDAAGFDGLRIDFKNKATSLIPSSGTWTSIITMDGYSDTGGGYPVQLGYSMSDLIWNNPLYYRSSISSSTWGQWRKILDSGTIGLEYTSDITYDPHEKRIVCNTVDWDWSTSSFWSKDGYSTDVGITFKCGARSQWSMVGLNTDPTNGNSYGYIDYCWYIDDYLLYIYESGSNIDGYGEFLVGTELSIIYSGGFVKYYKDGVLCRTVARGISDKLYADSSFCYQGNIYDLLFGKMFQKNAGDDNQSINALLHSGVGRSDNAAGDTWLFIDDAGGYSANWGIKHNQVDNLIEYYGSGSIRSYVDLQNGYNYVTRLRVSSGSSTALINTVYNNFAINFREGRSYDTGFFYGNYGNEFLALTTQQSVTSLIFGNGYDPASLSSGSFISGDGTNYTYGASTDVIQIKLNCVSIGDIWRHGVTPDYKLRVIGSTYSSSNIIAGGDVRVSGADVYIGSQSGSQCHQLYDSTNKCLKFLFD